MQINHGKMLLEHPHEGKIPPAAYWPSSRTVAARKAEESQIQEWVRREESQPNTLFITARPWLSLPTCARIWWLQGQQFLGNTSGTGWIRAQGRAALALGDLHSLDQARWMHDQLVDTEQEVAMESFDDDHEESWAYPGESGPKNHESEGEDNVVQLRDIDDYDDYDDYEEARRDPHWGVPYEDLYRDFTNYDVQEE